MLYLIYALLIFINNDISVLTNMSFDIIIFYYILLYFYSISQNRNDKYFLSVIQVNMTQTDITRMASDYADNELELFRKTVRLFTKKEI